MKHNALTAIAIAMALTMGACGNSNKAEAARETGSDAPTLEEEAPRPGAAADDDAPVRHVSQQQFESIVKVADNGTVTLSVDRPVVIDFNATWCPPCRQFGPIYEEVAASMKDKAIFLSVDVDRSRQAAIAFGVESIPQVSVVTPAGKVSTNVGFMTRSDFEQFLSETIGK